MTLILQNYNNKITIIIQDKNMLVKSYAFLKLPII